MFKNLPEVIEIVRSTHSAKIDPYQPVVKVIRAIGGHEWYDASVSPDGAGTFHINGLIGQVTLPDNGPEGFAYVKGGHPSFTADSIVQVEEHSDLVATYEMDSTGDPVLASHRVLANMGSNSGPTGRGGRALVGHLVVGGRK